MPNKKMSVPAVKPYFSAEDINYITRNFIDILQGNSYLSMGKFSEEFEERFAAAVGTKYGVACNSGTSALELILLALDVAGREVILPTNTFAATAYAALRAGAILKFADCGDDMCLDPAAVKKLISKKTAAVMHVHIGGLLSPGLWKIRSLCRKHKIHLVEDAAQAHGAEWKGHQAGDFGVAGGFSFFSTKVMTTGEGGMVTTDRKDLVRKMKSMREFGKVKKGVYINYHTSWGYNWRLPEVAALLGIRQLRALPKFLARRRMIAQRYTAVLSKNPNIKIIQPVDERASSHFKYIVVLPHHDRVKVHEALQEAGVSPSGYVYELPLHKQPIFEKYHSLSLPKSEYLCAHHISLPIFFTMTDEQVDYVADTLARVLDAR